MIQKLVILCFSFLTISAQAQDILEVLRSAEDASQGALQEASSSTDRSFRRGGGRGNGGGNGPFQPPPFPPQPRPPRPGNPGHGGGYPPPYPGYPGYGVQCVAQDNGHEEHYRGHGSCGECLSLHGNCTESCSQVTHLCTAEGFDRNGNRINFQARGVTQYQAEDEAYNRCRYRADNCQVTDCRQTNEVVSRRACR